MTRLVAILAALLVGLGSVCAQPKEELSLDDQYIQIFNLIDQGDVYNNNGKVGPALSKYREAQRDLLNLRQRQPNWSPAIVNFRLNYLSEKIASLSKTNTVTDAAGETEPKAAGEAASSTSPVRLLNPGAEPRQLLRFQPEAGAKQQMVMSMKISMDMGMGQALALPAMTLNFDSEVKEVSPEGDITYEIVLSNADVAEETGGIPGVGEAMKLAMGGMKGLTSTCTLSDRGLVKSSEVQLPANADPQARQMMDSMKDSLGNLAVQLPEQAIGPGAKWEVKLPVTSQGMTIQQTATYQLVSCEGNRLTLKTALAQQAANQKMENPSMPGMQADLTKMTGRATGEATIDLGKIIPERASMDIHSELSMSINMGNQKQPMQMKTDVKLTVEGK